MVVFSNFLLKNPSSHSAVGPSPWWKSNLENITSIFLLHNLISFTSLLLFSLLFFLFLPFSFLMLPSLIVSQLYVFLRPLKSLGSEVLHWSTRLIDQYLIDFIYSKVSTTIYPVILIFPLDNLVLGCLGTTALGVSPQANIMSQTELKMASAKSSPLSPHPLSVQMIRNVAFARHQAKYFTGILLSNPHDTSMRWLLVLAKYHKWGH